ncbi:hypothetical protein L596_008496 [Steinernema carpocapsae]|uniref:Uncharacterized protein n=2 Tax=Steinernema carpocapsae TaxID=34508 RepID=A0A4V6A6E8_STECR|nr:hypothetical protein L596_008496 [Steinernema carpocapsae]
MLWSLSNLFDSQKFKLLQNDKNAGSSEFLANSTVAACNKLGNEFDALETPIFGSQPDLIYVCCQNCSHPDVNPENKADKERLMLTMMAKFIRQKTVNERKPDTPTQASCKKDSTEAYMSSSQHSTWCASYDGRDISWTMSLSTNWCFLTWNNETISAGHYTKQREANLGNPPKCDGCKGEPHYDIDGAWNSCAEDNVTNTFTCCCWNTNDQVGNGTACNADMAKWTRLRLSSSLVKPDAKMIERKFCAYRSEENISCASLPKFHGCSLHHVHRSNATGAQRNTKVACVSPESEDPTLSAIHDLCLKFPVTEEGRLSCGSMQRDFSEVINFCCCEGIQSCNNAYDVLGRKFNRVGGEDEYEHLD